MNPKIRAAIDRLENAAVSNLEDYGAANEELTQLIEDLERKAGDEIKIFYSGKDYGEKYEIEDLYWFEENSIHSFEDGKFEIQVNGVKVYPSKD